MSHPKFPPTEPAEEAALEVAVGRPVRRLQLELEQLDQTWSRPPTAEEVAAGRVMSDEDVRSWGISRAQGLVLYGLLRTLRPRRVLELGGSFGYSTTWLTAGAAAGGGAVVSLEDDATKLPTLKRVQALFGGRLQIRPGDIGTSLEAADAKFDFVFIDAAPQQYAALAARISAVLEPGATVVVDNAVSPPNLVAHVLQIAQLLPLEDVWTLPLGHGMMIGRYSGEGT